MLVYGFLVIFKEKVFLITVLNYLLKLLINLVQSALSGELHPRPGGPITLRPSSDWRGSIPLTRANGGIRGSIAQRARVQVL